jgi:hypothetical protein
MRRLAPHLLVLIAGLAALSVAFGLAGRTPDGCPARSILDLEFAGAAHATEVYSCWHDATPSLTQSLLFDSVLVVPTYVLFLTYWCRRAHRTAITTHARRVSDAATAAVFIAGLFDLGENAFLWQLDRSSGLDLRAADWALAFTLPKWILLGFVTFVATQGLLRTIAFSRARPHRIDVFNAEGGSAWERNTRVPPPAGGAPPAGGVGVAFSGGGIRSASFGMGALQALVASKHTGPPGTLDGVRLISGVSGGGYLVAARQMLLATGRDIEPFLPGSYEIEHVRRHGRYIADSLLEWVEAGARLVAGIALNVGFLVALLYVVAQPSGWLQRAFLFRSASPDVDVSMGMWLAPALAGCIAGFLYILGVLARPRSDATGSEFGSRAYKLAAVFAATALVCFALVFLLPWIAVLTTKLVRLLHVSSGTIAASGGTLSAIATWLGLRPPTKSTLSRLLERRADDEAYTTPDETKKTETLKRKTWAAKLRLSRWLPGLLLVLTALFVLARFVARARRVGPGVEFAAFGTAWPSEVLFWIGALVLLLLLFVFADQTSWSLHPYYKRRLATAFAMTRLPGGEVGEHPYREPTPIDDIGRAPRGPQLILGAAANLTGNSAPPGRRALAYVFTPDWMGGPEIGYTTPASMREALGSRNAGDVTLVAAMAISGAAVASAMGRHNLGSLNAVLATFNLRLGVWLPSPRYLEHVAVGDAPSPGLRRLTLVLREVFGSYDKQDRFLYVTDGGHVENLGVVELLRRRCETVFCFDGSGGPSTLVEGIRLAYEELGVEIEFPDGYEQVREGSAAPDPAIAKDVAARLAATSVLVGTVRYPALADDLPEQTGTIVYARSVLTRSTPGQILEHAARNARFPNDPTGDQWFDVEQFNNYVALGREVGEAAIGALGGDGPPRPEARA